MATTEFRPFETTTVPQIGKILKINAVHAALPEALILPRRVRLDCTYHWRTGYQWFASRDYESVDPAGVVEMVSLPEVPGDGEPSLRQLVDWLERRGYRDASGLGESIWERAS